MPVTIQCAYCGASKLIPPSQVKANKTGKFYCSTKCHDLERRNSVKLKCKNCGKAFERKPSNVGEFCSHSCAHTWHWNQSPESEDRRKEAVERGKATSLKPDRETLYDLHVRQSLSVRDIGAMHGVKSQTVRKWIHAYEIPFTSRPLKVTPANKVEMPPENELRLLYENQKLTTKQIAKRFNVSSTTAKKWLQTYGIETRPPGTGLASRGATQPTAKQLHRMIHIERLTYEQIAAQYGVDFTAVYHWVVKHDIDRPETWFERHSKPDTLAAMRLDYEAGAPLEEIGGRYGNVAGSTVSNLFRSHNIPIRKGGWDGGKRFVCDDGHEVRSTYEQRVDNWLYKHGIEHTYEPQLPFSPTHKADFAANGWYIEVWGVTDSPTYKERKERKIDLYHAHLCPLIEIPQYAFFKASNNLWMRRLQQCLQPVLPMLLSKNPI